MLKFALGIVGSVAGFAFIIWLFNLLAFKGLKGIGSGITDKIKGLVGGIQDKINEAESNKKLNEITSKETEVVAKVKDVETKSEETKQKIKEVVERANKEVDEILKTDKTIGEIHDGIAEEFKNLR